MPRRMNLDLSDTMSSCPQCGGSGAVPHPDNPRRIIPCPLCRGDGRVSARTADLPATERYLRQRHHTENAIHGERAHELPLEERDPEGRREARSGRQHRNEIRKEAIEHDEDAS